MQITKFLPAAAVAAVCILPLSVPAQDTDAQIKAREAMRQKLNELQTTAPQVSPQPTNPAPRAPKAPKTKTQAAPKAPPAQAQPAEAQPASAPAATPAASDSDSISKARDAMRQKMKESMTPQVVTPPPNQQSIPTLPVRPVRTAPAPVSAPEQAVKPAPAAVPSAPAPVPQQAAKPAPTPAPAQAAKSMPTPTPAPVAQSTDRPTLVLPPSADPEALAKARDAMHAKMTEVQGSQPAPNMAAHPGSGSHEMAQTPHPPKHIAHYTATSFQPIEGPALPYSGAKKEQLDELLRKYRGDELTPEQYHQQRAKILAQP
jgi:hypothetical protein